MTTCKMEYESYGIWKSVWQEDINGVFTEKYPFSVKGLRSLVTEAEGMNEDEFNKAKANKKAQNVDDPKRSESETDVHFSLPENTTCRSFTVTLSMQTVREETPTTK